MAEVKRNSITYQTDNNFAKAEEKQNQTKKISHRRGNGDGSIFQNDKGNWIGQVDFGTINGKRHRKTLRAKTKSELVTKMKEVQLQRLNQTYVEPSKLTYGNYLENWLKIKKCLDMIKDTTLDGYKQYIRNYINPCLGSCPIQKLTTTMINNFYASLLDKDSHIQKHGRPLSSSMLYRIHTVVHNSLRYAKKDKIISVNVADDATLPKLIYPEQRYLNEKEIEILKQATSEYHNCPTTKTINAYPAVMLLLSSGIRRGELCGLRWNNIDMDRGTIKISETIQEINGICKVSTPKSLQGKRTISISLNMVNILNEQRNKASGEYVFPSLNDLDKPMPPRSLNRMFYAIIKKAGLNINLHSLRHTHITQLVLNGVDLKTVQYRAGHANISTTIGYTHVNLEKDKEASAIFDKFF